MNRSDRRREQSHGNQKKVAKALVDRITKLEADARTLHSRNQTLVVVLCGLMARQEVGMFEVTEDEAIVLGNTKRIALNYLDANDELPGRVRAECLDVEVPEEEEPEEPPKIEIVKASAPIVDEPADSG